jgi:hypothetical protein
MFYSGQEIYNFSIRFSEELKILPYTSDYRTQLNKLN